MTSPSDETLDPQKKFMNDDVASLDSRTRAADSHETLDGESVVHAHPDPKTHRTGPRKPASDAKVNKKKSPLRLLSVVVVLAILGLCGGAYYWFFVAPYETTDDAYVEGNVISITPQVSALVSMIHFDDNQYVHKGDLLVELNPKDYQVALNQARGAEAAAEGKLEQARASVGAAESTVAQDQAAIESSQAVLENTEQNLKRYQTLDQEARAQQDLDSASANRKTAAASVAQANAQLKSAGSQVSSAKANVIAAAGDLEKAKADTERAEVNLSYCRIMAPTDGRITQKSVDPGDYVTPANPLFQIVPPEVWVIANFKETQLNHIRPGQVVTMKVDAYPKMALHGKVESIQSGTGSRFSIIPAENATGNFVKIAQRVPVKIVLNTDTNDNSGRLLSQGMSVEPKVRIR